jgi:hypothetical protein
MHRRRMVVLASTGLVTAKSNPAIAIDLIIYLHLSIA